MRAGVLLGALKGESDTLTLPLLMTLLAVGRKPGISVNELADEIGSPQQTASRYVAILQGRYQSVASQTDAFVRAPLIALEVSADDPRRRALGLTRAGQKRLEAFVESVFGKGRVK